MALISFSEATDMILMSVIVGFIFMKLLERAKGNYMKSHNVNHDPLKQSYGFDWDLFKKAVIIVAPAIIFHEFGHKFVAMAFGATATFYAAYRWLFFGAFLALMNSPFIVFVPAYVSIPMNGLTSLQFSMVAAAGPLVNALLWGLAAIAIKYNWFNKKYYPILIMTKKINMFLFIFNMLPIPGFDGFKVYSGLFSLL